MDAHPPALKAPRSEERDVKESSKQTPHSFGVWISRLQQPEGLGSIIHRITAAPCSCYGEAVPVCTGWMLVAESFPPLG